MEPIKKQKRGLSLFYDKLKEQGLEISGPDTSSGETNGTVEITNNKGKTTKQNLKKISEVYGGLTFYHMSSEEAIDEIVELIIHNLNEK